MIPAAYRDSGTFRHFLLVSLCGIGCLSVASLAFIDVDKLNGTQVVVTVDKSKPNGLRYEEVTRHPRSICLPPGVNFEDTEPYSSEGLFRVSKYEGERPYYGYADQSGKIVIPVKFSSLSVFVNGLAAAEIQNDQKQDGGFIDKSGNWVGAHDLYTVSIDAVGTKFTQDSKGVWTMLGAGNKRFLTDRSSGFYHSTVDSNLWRSWAKQTALPTKGEAVYSARKSSGGNFALIDADGNLLTDYKYSSISESDQTFSQLIYTRVENLSPVPQYHATPFLSVNVADRYGLLDFSGKELVPCKYGNVISFNDGHAVVSPFDDSATLETAHEQVTYKNKKFKAFGMVDERGNYLIKPEFRYVSQYAEVIAVCNKDKKWSFLNSKGKDVSLPSVDAPILNADGSWFSEGLARVLVGDKVGFIDTTGKLVIPAKYDFVEPFHSGYALAWHDDHKHFDYNNFCRFIDKQGRAVKGTKFGTATSLLNGSAFATRRGPAYNLTRFVRNQQDVSALADFKGNLRRFDFCNF